MHLRDVLNDLRPVELILEAHKELGICWLFGMRNEENSKTKNIESREGAHIPRYSVAVLAGANPVCKVINNIQAKRKQYPVGVSKQEPKVMLFHRHRTS